MRLENLQNNEEEVSGHADDIYFVVYKPINRATHSSTEMAVGAMADRIAALEAALAEAREVVKPFTHPDLHEGDASPLFVQSKATLTHSDFRRAAEWLKKQEAE